MMVSPRQIRAIAGRLEIGSLRLTEEAAMAQDPGSLDPVIFDTAKIFWPGGPR